MTSNIYPKIQNTKTENLHFELLSYNYVIHQRIEIFEEISNIKVFVLKATTKDMINIYKETSSRFCRLPMLSKKNNKREIT